MLFTHLTNVLVISLLYGSSVLVHTMEQGHSSGVDEPPPEIPQLDGIIGASPTHLAPNAEANKKGTCSFLFFLVLQEFTTAALSAPSNSQSASTNDKAGTVVALWLIDLLYIKPEQKPLKTVSGCPFILVNPTIDLFLAVPLRWGSSYASVYCSG